MAKKNKTQNEDIDTITESQKKGMAGRVGECPK